MTDMSVPPMTGPIGQSIRRREDERFITGAGRYTDDVVLHGQTFGVFVRSPHAHARIRAIRTDAARQAPGVVDIPGGGSSEIEGLSAGDHRFQCCIHPWMRTQIAVSDKE